MARHVVTGAFDFSGKYIAARLLVQGHAVHTITNSLQRPDPFQGRVTASLLHFDDPPRLVESLAGADVLYNTYWVRFNHREFTHHTAVENTRTLFGAAREAGVRRIVHVSITNPSEESDLEYFRGKAELERALRTSGMSHTILRPAVLFGREDVLVNNIAWLLRKLPVFGVFGDGSYRLQPIHVDDLAELAVREAGETENRVIDAIGPETFTYRGLVETIAAAIGRRRLILKVSPRLGFLAARVLGALLGDTLLTREEIDGLMRELLYVESAPAGHTRLSDWAREHADELGTHYASELRRRRDRETPYDEI